jgi:hypothetical protein
MVFAVIGLNHKLGAVDPDLDRQAIAAATDVILGLKIGGEVAIDLFCWDVLPGMSGVNYSDIRNKMFNLAVNSALVD